jgi:hypothetical protein
MNDQAKSTDQLVAEYLESIKVEFSAFLIGETMRDAWKADQWKISFKRGKQELEEMYYTGIGLRKLRKNAIPFGTGSRNSIAYAEWEKVNKLPVKPSSASVLYSLLSDARAIDDSFENWSSEYGYDSDSLKAFDIYRQCCASGKRIYAFFSRAEVGQLEEMLQDY